jgi:hypothetical protein
MWEPQRFTTPWAFTACYRDSFTFLPVSCGFVNVPPPLRREDGCVAYNCCWALPARSFSGPSPVGLMTIFHCLRFETPPTWRARSPYLYPAGTGWPSYTPRHGVLFSVNCTTRSGMIEVLESASTRGSTESQGQSLSHIATDGSRCIALARAAQKTQVTTVSLLLSQVVA